jgi:hypothetical protein
MLPAASLKKLLVAIATVAIVAVFFVPPIPQDASYHHFADGRNWLLVPNYWNVLTNLGFLWVGLLGLYKLFIAKQLQTVPSVKINYAIFFIGVALVAFGSGCYHWQPSNHTLICDRLPMTLAFMALLSIALAEFLSVPWGRVGLWPLLAIGLLSVAYWYVGELKGGGDLRLYVLVQFLPIVMLPILLVAGNPVFKQNWGYCLLLAAYILAKIAEHFDQAIFKLTGGAMAGHAIKHVLVVLGLYGLLRYFERRRLNR